MSELEPWSLAAQATQRAQTRDLEELRAAAARRKHETVAATWAADVLAWELGRRVGVAAEVLYVLPSKVLGVWGVESSAIVVTRDIVMRLDADIRAADVREGDYVKEPWRGPRLVGWLLRTCPVCRNTFAVGTEAVAGSRGPFEISTPQLDNWRQLDTSRDFYRRNRYDTRIRGWQLARSREELLLQIGGRLRVRHFIHDTPCDELLARARQLPASSEAPASPQVESPIEELFWQAHGQLRLPELNGLVAQYEAEQYRIDFALPGQKIGVELDGYAWHSTRGQFVKDRRRQRDLELQGWRFVRFAGVEVKADPADCVRQAAAFVRLVTDETA